jgi:membrane associated rhomboid family serine protease
MLIPYRDELSRPGSFPFWVIVILLLNILAFLLELALEEKGALDAFLLMYGCVPKDLFHGGASLTPLITSLFLHGGFLHLAGNMLYLWIFADNVEDLLGKIGFPIFYVACGVAATLVHVLLQPHSDVPVIGASGAISGVLGAYMWNFPRNRVTNFYWFFLFIGTFRLPAWFYLGFWFFGQVAMAGEHGAIAGGVAVGAHLGGFIAGIVLVRIFPKNLRALRFYRRLHQ